MEITDILWVLLTISLAIGMSTSIGLIVTSIKLRRKIEGDGGSSSDFQGPDDLDAEGESVDDLTPFDVISDEDWQMFASDLYNLDGCDVSRRLSGDAENSVRLHGHGHLDVDDTGSPKEVSVTITCKPTMGMNPLYAHILVDGSDSPLVHSPTASELAEYYRFLLDHDVNPLGEWLSERDPEALDAAMSRPYPTALDILHGC